MILKPSPKRQEGRPNISVSGDVLTIDRAVFDFSEIPNGATLPRSAIISDWIDGDVIRGEDGYLKPVQIVISVGRNAPYASRFPEPITVTEGPVTLPPYDEEPEA